MSLAHLSLANTGLCTAGNERGWSPWTFDEGRIAANLAKCSHLYDSGRVSGLYLVGGCGMLPGNVECGYYSDGRNVYTCWAGHSQGSLHELVHRFAAVLPVTVSIGLPADFLGLNALRHECAGIGGSSIELVFDAAGGNLDSRVDAAAVVCDRFSVFYRLESRPAGDEVHTGALYVTMPARAQELIRLRRAFAGDIVPFHMGDDANGYNKTLALMCENRKAIVAQPLELFLVEGDAGGAV